MSEFEKIKNVNKVKSHFGKKLHLINEKGYTEQPNYKHQEVTVNTSGLIRAQLVYGQETGLVYSVSPSWESPQHIGGISSFMYSMQAASRFPTEVHRALGSYPDLYRRDIYNNPIRIQADYTDPGTIEYIPGESVVAIKKRQNRYVTNKGLEAGSDETKRKEAIVEAEKDSAFNSATRWGLIPDRLVIKAIKAYGSDKKDLMLKDDKDIDNLRQNYSRMIKNVSTMQLGNQLVFAEPYAIHTFCFSKGTTAENVQYAVWAERVKVLVQDAILREFNVWMPPYLGEFVKFESTRSGSSARTDL